VTCTGPGSVDDNDFELAELAKLVLHFSCDVRAEQPAEEAVVVRREDDEARAAVARG
jgi:hypothetical protein